MENNKLIELSDDYGLAALILNEKRFELFNEYRKAVEERIIPKVNLLLSEGYNVPSKEYSITGEDKIEKEDIATRFGLSLGLKKGDRIVFAESLELKTISKKIESKLKEIAINEGFTKIVLSGYSIIINR